jgi:hypothetical protein
MIIVKQNVQQNPCSKTHAAKPMQQNPCSKTHAAKPMQQNPCSKTHAANHRSVMPALMLFRTIQWYIWLY